MTRAEALSDFKTNIVQEMLIENKTNFLEQLKKEEDTLFKNTKKSFEEIRNQVKKLQQTLRDYKVRYLQISLLRTSIIGERYTYLVSVHNEDYFLDYQGIKLAYNMPELFEHLTVLKHRLYNLRKKYIGKIQDYDVDKIILEQAILYNKEISQVFRGFLNNVEDTAIIKDINIADKFLIKWGEHRELSETIYCIDTTQKSQEEFTIFNKKNTIKNNDQRFNYSVWNRMTFNQLECKEKRLIFNSFRGCKLKDSKFALSILYGSNFRKAEIRRCKFQNCNLEKCNFVEAKLDEVNFDKASLKGSNFKGATFNNVSFNDTELEGAIFLSKVVAYLHLSAEQLQQIIIEDE